MADQPQQGDGALLRLLARAGLRLRLPLQELISTLDRLGRADLESDPAKLVGSARTSTDALFGAVQDLLDVIRIEAGELAFDATEFDLRALVEGVCVALIGAARARRLELVCVVPPDLPSLVTGDPVQIRRILSVLADNAIRFTETGEVVVGVVTRRSTASRGEDGGDGDAPVGYRFEVRETGAGIPPAAVSRLFDGSPDGPALNAVESNGAELSLAIVRGLVRAMRGEIGVESVVGNGTRFWFELPLPGRHASGDAATAASDAIAGRRILVAQSSDSGRKQLLDQLAAWRVEAHGESTAAAALRAIRTEAGGPLAFEAVLVDSALNDIDGITLARLIRRDPSIGAIPLVLMKDTDVPDDGIGLDGARAYLDKPVRRQALLDALCSVLDPTAGSTTPRPAAPLDMPGAQPGMRILLVEDYDVNLEVALALMKQAEYDVTVARNGQQAIERFVADGPFDAVIMDCMMPVMDGYTAAIRIRGVEHETGAGRTPIIALTAAALKEDRDRCFASGMDDYLTKPVRGHELRAMLVRWTTDRSRAATTDGRGATAGDGIIDEAAIAALRNLRSRNSDVLGRLIEAYVRDTPLKCAALRDAAGRADIHAFRRVIQSMKNASRTLGAHRVTDLCQRADALAGTDPDGAMQSGCIDALVRECERAMTKLAAIEERGEACPIV
jgi:two-component system, sensor histidine kinase and response regulator